MTCFLVSTCVHVRATVSVRFRDWAKSGRIRGTLLPEFKDAVMSLPLAFSG